MLADGATTYSTRLPPVTRRNARLASDLPATALAGLDFHQLNTVDILSLESPSQALLGAMKLLSARRYGMTPESIHVGADFSRRAKCDLRKRLRPQPYPPLRC